MGGRRAAVETELAKVEEQSRSLGVDPKTSRKWQDLSAELADIRTLAELKEEVFSHLLTFFSRYYDSGDFISKRRYKRDTYAIPYEGEEVKLVWANMDQHYFKTTGGARRFSLAPDDPVALAGDELFITFIYSFYAGKAPKQEELNAESEIMLKSGEILARVV